MKKKLLVKSIFPPINTADQRFRDGVKFPPDKKGMWVISCLVLTKFSKQIETCTIDKYSRGYKSSTKVLLFW